MRLPSMSASQSLRPSTFVRSPGSVCPEQGVEPQTAAEREEFHRYGLHWRGRVWGQGDMVARDQILAELNQLPGFRFSRGFQPYDPVVRVNGRAYSYQDIANWACSQADGGRAAAAAFVDWGWGARGLFTLPPELQALAAITAFAEVGRGYLRAEHDLQHWMTTVAGEANRDDACTEWQAFNQYYTPSLTYRVDAAGDY